MKYFFAGFIWGLIALAFFLTLPNSKLSMYDTAIKKCEANLPRNQHCVITAIPEVKP